MFFNRFIGLRIRNDEYKQISYLVSKNRDRYENESHFMRVAIMRLLKDEENQQSKRRLK